MIIKRAQILRLTFAFQGYKSNVFHGFKTSILMRSIKNYVSLYQRTCNQFQLTLEGTDEF